MKTITSSQGDSIIVDDQDYERLSKIKWSVRRSIRGKNSKERITIRNTKVGMSMARFIMDCPKDKIVDHINGNALDNRRQNLRICNYSQNNVNRPTRSKTGVRGVYLDKVINGKNWYDVCITVNKKYIYLGYTSCLKEGARIYNEAANKYFGEFARLNPVE